MTEESQKNLISIVGPTACGKTDLSIAIAKELKTEILSADSRQFFSELKIGAAFPNIFQLAEIQHHFIGHLSVSDSYSVIHYENDAMNRISLLFQKFDTLVLVGGSGLYIDAVCRGFDDIPDTDPEIRQELVARFELEGIDSLRFELKQLDPDYYFQSDIRNPKRILRALEVVLSTGKPFSVFRKNQFKNRNFRIIKIGIDYPRAQLHQRINERVNKMIESGLISEAQSLVQYCKQNALNTVGYKEIFSFFDGKTSKDEAIELIKRNTRRYARRQISWFRRDPEIHWFGHENLKNIPEFLKHKLK